MHDLQMQGGSKNGIPTIPTLARLKAFLDESIQSSLAEAVSEERAERLEIRVLPEYSTLEEVISVVANEEARKRPEEDMFFLVNLSFPISKYLTWTKFFPRVFPCYAVKCNPHPLLVRALASVPGCGFDCASIAELRLVLESGVGPHRIIFANPCKTPEALSFALLHDVRTMTFDSKNELLKIAQGMQTLRRQQQQQVPDPQLVLRLRVPDEQSNVPLGEKYGAQIETCDELITVALSLNLHLIGVSFHCGSGSHSPENFCDAVRLAKSVFQLAEEKHGLKLALLDIGGGWPGWGDAAESLSLLPQQQHGILPLSCEAIAKDVAPLLDELFPSGVRLISEPGRFFVEGSHVLFTQICERRWIDADGVPTSAPLPSSSLHNSTCDLQRRHHPNLQLKRVAYIVAEGCMGCFKDALLCGEQFVPNPLPMHRSVASSAQEGGEPTCYESIVMGPSGEAFDCIADKGVSLPLLEVGDWLYFHRVGAYTASIASSNSSVYSSSKAYAYVATAYI